MKRIAFSLILIMLSGFAVMAQTEKSIVVFDKSGSQSFALSEVRKITFTDDALVVNLNNGATQSVMFADLQYFSFASGSPIRTVQENQGTIYWSAATSEVKASGLSRIRQIEIFDMQGRRTLNVTPDSPTASVDFASSPRGVYIVRMTDEAGVTVRKFVK
jgi:hypothetical protein